LEEFEDLAGRMEAMETSLQDLDVISVARRVQRLELLLFNMPEVDFSPIDSFIANILSTGLQAEVNANRLQSTSVLNGSCEFFSLTDECDAAHDDLCHKASSLDATAQADLLVLQTKLEEASKKLESFAGELTMVNTKVEALSPPLDAAVLVQAINSNTDAQVGSFRTQVSTIQEDLDALRTSADDTQKRISAIEACWELLGSSAATAVNATGAATRRKKRQDKG
jgi:peptidoglycan hydrolase CwlO-like protein